MLIMTTREKRERTKKEKNYADYDDWLDASDVKKKGKDRYFEEEKKQKQSRHFIFSCWATRRHNSQSQWR